MAPNDTPPFDPWRDGLNAADLEVSRFCCIELPLSLIPYITGALEGLRYPEAWLGSDADVKRAIQIFSTVIGEFSSVIRACSDTSNAGDCHSVPDCTETIDCSGDSEMSNPCLPVKIENGGLYYWNKCEWVKVGNVSGDDSGHGVLPPVEIETPEAQVDVRCTKATVVGNLIWKVADAIFQVIEDTPPWDFAEAVEDRAGIQLDSPGLIGAWGTYWTHKIVLVDHYSSGFGDQQEADFICKYSKVTDGSLTSISNSEMDRIHATLAQTLGVDVVATGFFENVVLAINKGRFERAVKMANAAGLTYECPCVAPEPAYDVIPDGVEYSWSKLIDFKLGSYGFIGHGNGGAVYEAGVGWTYSDTSFDSARLPKIKRAAAGAFSPTKLTYIKIHLTGWPSAGFGGGGDYKFFAYNDQEIIGSNYMYQESIMGLWPNPGGKSPSIELVLNPADMYWSASANPGYKTVIDKIVLAGLEDDFWTKIQPDGTFSE